MGGKKRTTIICTREYENGKLVYRKIEVVRSHDGTPGERDTKHNVRGFEGATGTPHMGHPGPGDKGHS